MNFIQLVTLQFIAYLLSGFVFQPGKWIDDKIKNGIKSRYYYLNQLIVFGISWVFSFQWGFVVGAVIITVFNGLLGFINHKLYNYQVIGKYLFFLTHLFQVSVITFVSWYLGNNYILTPWLNLNFNTGYIIIIAAYLFCTKPANHLIKEIFRLYSIKIAKNDSELFELPNAGKLIGNVERLLTLTFVLMGRYEAVGFLIAAKSILRFGEKDNIKSEYVLIGTLLSFGIAIIIGVVINLCFL